MLQLSPPESRLGKQGSMSSAEGATADAVAGLCSRAAERIVTFLSYSKWESIAADSSKHCLSSTPPTCSAVLSSCRGLVIAHQQAAVDVAPILCRLPAWKQKLKIRCYVVARKGQSAPAYCSTSC